MQHSWSKLPVVFPTFRYGWMGEEHPEKVESRVAAFKPTPPVRAPKGMSMRGQAVIGNLPWFRGMSREQYRKYLERQKVRVSMAKKIAPLQKVNPTSAMPAPQVKTAMPKLADLSQRPAMYLKYKAITSQLEWNIFMETWNEYVKTQSLTAESTTASQMDDLITICWETVLQSRMQIVQARSPEKFSAKAYQESHDRLQEARKSLMASCAPAPTKGQDRPSINIAVMAGAALPGIRAHKDSDVVIDATARDEDDFLQSTRAIMPAISEIAGNANKAVHKEEQQ